jgi:hypothetical protein
MKAGAALWHSRKTVSSNLAVVNTKVVKKRVVKKPKVVKGDGFFGDLASKYGRLLPF